MAMMLESKLEWFSYLSSKWVVKQWRSLKTTMHLPRNTSAVVVQGVLQRGQEPWREGAQWSAVRRWKWPIKNHYVWWSAALLSHYNFLNPGKTITSEKYAQQIDEMHWRLQCLQPALVNRKGPILPGHDTWPHITQPMLQKLNELGYELLPHLTSPTTYHFFKHLNNFCRENASTTSRMQNMLSKSSSNSEAQIFMLQE